MTQHASNADDSVGQIQPHGLLLQLCAAIVGYWQVGVKFGQARENKTAFPINLRSALPFGTQGASGGENGLDFPIFHQHVLIG